MAALLVVGCGYLGLALARRRLDAGDRVLALTRHPEHLPDTLVRVAGDVSRPNGFDGVTEPIDRVVFCVGPDRKDETTYARCFLRGTEHLMDWLLRSGNASARLVFVSSTSVYAQSAGEWVDETSEARPESPTAKILLAAESSLRARQPRSVILRLAGIYGPERKSLLASHLERGPRITRASGWINRMYVTDCARALEHLLALPDPAPLYLGADDEPASQEEVLRWLSEHFELPPLQSGSAEIRHRGGKRCSNARLKGSGFTLEFPTFREGYGHLARELGLEQRRRSVLDAKPVR